MHLPDGQSEHVAGGRKGREGRSERKGRSNGRLSVSRGSGRGGENMYD